MTVQPFEITKIASEASRKLRQYAFSGKAPAIIEERLQNIPGSESDVILEGAEILYAHRDLLDDDGLVTMGILYGYAGTQHYSHFDRDNRCERIVLGVRRDRGEEGDFDSLTDPEPETNRREDGLDWRLVSPQIEEEEIEDELP